MMLVVLHGERRVFFVALLSYFTASGAFCCAIISLHGERRVYLLRFTLLFRRMKLYYFVTLHNEASGNVGVRAKEPNDFGAVRICRCACELESSLPKELRLSGREVAQESGFPPRARAFFVFPHIWIEVVCDSDVISAIERHPRSRD